MPLERAATTTQQIDSTLLAAIVETAGNVILGLRPDGTVFAWNAAAEQLYQVPRHRALGMPYVETFVAPEVRESVSVDIAEVLAGKRTMNYENDLLLADGSRRTLLWNVSRVVERDGSITGLVAIGQDITVRKEVEARFRLVFEHAMDGLLLADDSGVIDCNPAALRMLGLQHKMELVGRRVAEFSPPLQPDGTPSAVKSKQYGAQALAQGSIGFEWVHQRADGTPVPVEVHVRHARMSGRRISVVSWRDLTRRHAMQREREALEQRLQLAQKMEAVGQLAGGVAHEFNNLLAAIRNAIQLAVHDAPDSLASRHDLELALETTERAAQLTGQLLAFSRRQPRATATVDLAALVRDLVPLLRTSLPTSIALEAQVTPAEAIVRADRSQLEQVVLNLVLNARDAMEEAGGTLTLSVSVHDGARQVALVVRDTGRGMEPDLRERIFEPFFTTKPVGSGTGLGLSVVYGVVAQAGGTVRVESAPGGGTSMHVMLPQQAPLPGDVAPDGAGDTGAGPSTVLLVDDDTAVRSTTRRLLERQGFRVIEAAGGHEALERIRMGGEAVSVLLTDIRMPEMDGVSLAAAVRALLPAFPVVFISGFDEVVSPDVPGLSDVTLLAKPFSAAGLFAALQSAIARGATIR